MDRHIDEETERDKTETVKQTEIKEEKVDRHKHTYRKKYIKRQTETHKQTNGQIETHKQTDGQTK